MRNRRILHPLHHLCALALLGAAAIGCSSGGDEAASSDELTGTLVKTVGRDQSGATVIEYYVSSEGRRIHLVSDAPITLEPNASVHVVGRLSDDGKRFDADVIDPGPSDAGMPQSLSEAAAEGSVAVFLIKDDTIAGEPFSQAEVQDQMFSGARSSSAFFNEASFGNYQLQGQVFGWYTVDLLDCNDSWNWLDQAMEQAAAQDGFDTNQFRHAVGLFSRDGDGCFLAVGTLGQPDGVGWVWSFANDGDIYSHELGHNLGLHHASGLYCKDANRNPVSYSSRCFQQEYNDPYDVMGYGGFYHHPNAYSKALEGWLPPANVQRVTSAGQYHLVPQEQSSTQTQSLLVPIPGTDELYQIEARIQWGFDDLPQFANAVLVRRVKEPGLGNQTYLLDMSPDNNLSDASLQVGQTFADQVSGITIRLVQRQANDATIAVAFNGVRCNDGVKNGTETAADCGGANCAPCANGRACVSHSDCASSACVNRRCVASDGGLVAQYFTGMDLTNLTATRTDKVIDFDWDGASPMPQLPGDQFSVRWSGKVVPRYTETYTFEADTDDGARLWIGNQLIIDRWGEVGAGTGTIALTAGRQYDIRLDYFEDGGLANARLRWSSARQALEVIPPTQLLPVCTAGGALDLGARVVGAEVPSNACVKVSQYPEWWQYGSGTVQLQSGAFGGFPVPGKWTDSCTGANGTFSFGRAWQSIPIGNHPATCPVAIQLQGSGGPLQLFWY